MASKSSIWGTIGWWIIVGMAITFGPYASVFVQGKFEVYRMMTTTAMQGKFDIAGLNILHHLRAWQIHSAAAIVFMGTGPFQFSPSFRAKFPTIHRIFGYAFVIAGLVCSISALTVLIPNTEFGPIPQKFWTFQAVVMALFLLFAVKLAREKKFKLHQQYMIRGAATGYSVIAMRPFIAILVAVGLPIPMAMDISAVGSPILFLGVAELYIQRVLTQAKVTELRIEERPQAGWMGEQTGHEIGKSSGWVGGHNVHTRESMGTSEPVSRKIAPSGNKDMSPPSAHIRSGPNNRSIVFAGSPFQRINKQARAAGVFDHALSRPSPIESKILHPTCWVRTLGCSNRTGRTSLPTMGFQIKPCGLPNQKCISPSNLSCSRIT